MKTQDFVPVMLNSNQILGQAELDAPVEFVGDEEEVEIDGVDYPLINVSYTRTNDGVAVEFMAIVMTQTQVDNREHLSIKNFTDITTTTLPFAWIFGGSTQGTQPDQSAMRQFLTGIEYESS